MNETKLTALNCSGFVGGKKRKKTQQARLQKIEYISLFWSRTSQKWCFLPTSTYFWQHVLRRSLQKQSVVFFWSCAPGLSFFFFLKCTWTQEGWILNGFSFLRVYICWDVEKTATRSGKWWNTERTYVFTLPSLWNNQCNSFDRVILQWENRSLQRFPLRDRSSPLVTIHTW